MTCRAGLLVLTVYGLAKPCTWTESLLAQDSTKYTMSKRRGIQNSTLCGLSAGPVHGYINIRSVLLLMLMLLLLVASCAMRRRQNKHKTWEESFAQTHRFKSKLIVAGFSTTHLLSRRTFLKWQHIKKFYATHFRNKSSLSNFCHISSSNL